MIFSSPTTSTDPIYIEFCDDMINNIPVNHSDTIIVLNRGFNAAGDGSGGVGLCYKTI